MTEEELKEVVERFRTAPERAREERDEGLRRARAEGWRPVDIQRVTGYSAETIRQALNPEARVAARQQVAERRAAAKKQHDQ